MNSEDDDTQQGFLRQRRNLFVVSIVLAVVQLTGATIGESFTVLGVTINLESPFLVVYVLWCLWLYWFYRYYVYHRELMPLGFLNAIEARRIVELKKLARKQAANEIKRDCMADEDDPLPPGKFIFREAGTATDYDYGETTCERSPSGAVYKLMPSLVVRFESTSKGPNYKSFETGPETREYEWPRSSSQVRKASRRARLWVLFHTHYATEYGFPYMIAAIPACILLAELARDYAQPSN